MPRDQVLLGSRQLAPNREKVLKIHTATPFLIIIIQNIIIHVNKITGVGSNTVTFLRDVITEGLVALRYTVVKQRKGADLNEGKFEELVDPVAVYPWRRAGGACLLLFCGMCHRKLRHYFQSYKLYALYGTDWLASVRRVQRRMCRRLQPVTGKCVPTFAKQSPRKNWCMHFYRFNECGS